MNGYEMTSQLSLKGHWQPIKRTKGSSEGNIVKDAAKAISKLNPGKLLPIHHIPKGVMALLGSVLDAQIQRIGTLLEMMKGLGVEHISMSIKSDVINGDISQDLPEHFFGPFELRDVDDVKGLYATMAGYKHGYDVMQDMLTHLEFQIQKHLSGLPTISDPSPHITMHIDL